MQVQCQILTWSFLDILGIKQIEMEIAVCLGTVVGINFAGSDVNILVTGLDTVNGATVLRPVLNVNHIKNAKQNQIVQNAGDALVTAIG